MEGQLNDPIVEVSGLMFAYEKSASVLSNLGFAMCKGSSLMIVGDNGSGKSTLGRLLAGVLRPSQGSVLIGGREPSDVRPHPRSRLVSYVQQVTHLSILTTSIAEELRSYSRDEKTEAVERRYVEWAVAHNLPLDLADNPRDLTSPDLWRLVVGFYTVVLCPMVLVIDEVFCAGRKQQEDCLLSVLERRKREERVTIVLYQRALTLPFDSIVTLRGGQLSPLQK